MNKLAKIAAEVAEEDSPREAAEGRRKVNCQVIHQATRCELTMESGCYPRVEISASAIVASLSLDIDAVELSKFKAEVRRFIEERLPKHVKVVDREGGAE